MKPTYVFLKLLLIACVFSSCSILNHHTVATYNRNVLHGPFDVVIVPGLPYDTANINPMLKARILWAKELYHNGIARNIIFSGNAVHSPYVEAVVMKMMADSLGIPNHHTFIEDKALHSNENIAYGVALANQMGFKKIAVATDPIQAILMQKYKRDNNYDVHLLPFSITAMPLYYKTPVPAINHQVAFVADFVPLKERESNTLVIQD